LPGVNGCDACRELRSKVFTAPIIMVTGRAEEVDRVVGLEIGADDYLTKPFAGASCWRDPRASAPNCPSGVLTGGVTHP